MKSNREGSLLLWFQGYFHPNSGALQYGYYHWPLLRCEGHAELRTLPPHYKVCYDRGVQKIPAILGSQIIMTCLKGKIMSCLIMLLNP
jgi:hypothetical protein